MKRCQICGTLDVPPRNRKYCRACRSNASARWKRLYRRELAARGETYWRDWWPSDESRRAYHREYMRRRRQSERELRR